MLPFARPLCFSAPSHLPVLPLWYLYESRRSECQLSCLVSSCLAVRRHRHQQRKAPFSGTIRTSTKPDCKLFILSPARYRAAPHTRTLRQTHAAGWRRRRRHDLGIWRGGLGVPSRPGATNRRPAKWSRETKPVPAERRGRAHPTPQPPTHLSWKKKVKAGKNKPEKRRRGLLLKVAVCFIFAAADVVLGWVGGWVGGGGGAGRSSEVDGYGAGSTCWDFLETRGEAFAKSRPNSTTTL